MSQLMYDRILKGMGSIFILGGAVLIGAVLNATIVEQRTSLGSPFGVLGVFLGVGLIVVGYHLESRFEPTEHVPDTEADNSEPEEYSGPVPPERLERLESDEEVSDTRRSGEHDE